MQVTNHLIVMRSSFPLSTSSTPKLHTDHWRRWIQFSTRHPAFSMWSQPPATSPTATARTASFSSTTRILRITYDAPATFQRQRPSFLANRMIWRLERVLMLSTARIAPLRATKPSGRAGYNHISYLCFKGYTTIKHLLQVFNRCFMNHDCR